jgi:hypothetical protein
MMQWRIVWGRPTPGVFLAPIHSATAVVLDKGLNISIGKPQDRALLSWSNRLGD